MFSTMRYFQPATLTATLALALVGVPQASFAAGGSPAGQSDDKIASDAQSKLDKKQFKDVKVRVDNNGIATLTGTVDLYEYKSDADKRIHKVKGIKAVRNDIEVAGPTDADPGHRRFGSRSR